MNANKLVTACVDHGKKGDKCGYAKAKYSNGKTTNMHRLIWCNANGVSVESIRGLVVRHKCDNPRCIALEHLEIGTYQDNTDDRQKRGRTVVLRGEKCGTSRMTEKDVRMAFALSRQGLTQVEIAKRIGCYQAWVSSVLLRQSWRHVVIGSEVDNGLALEVAP